MSRFSRVAGPTSLLVLLVASLYMARPVEAQAPSQPSTVFGALPFPEFDALNEFGVVVDRFTNDTKPSDLLRNEMPDACKEFGRGVGRTCNYRLDRVIGFNSVYGAFSRRLRRYPAIVRMVPLVGYTGNQPSEFFQNDFLHNRNGLDDVRWADSLVYSSAVMSLGTDVTAWCCRNNRKTSNRSHALSVFDRAFVGAGGTIGTIVNESYVHAGVRRAEWSWKDKAIVQVSAMMRVTVATRPGFVLMERAGPGDPDRSRRGVYPAGSIGRSHNIVAGSIGIPLDQWIPMRGIMPAIEFGVSRSGFFAVHDGAPDRQEAYRTGRIDVASEQFRTIAVTWLNGDFGLETWNDSMGNKDQGPSYGARLFLRWRPTYP